MFLFDLILIFCVSSLMFRTSASDFDFALPPLSERGIDFVFDGTTTYRLVLPSCGT